MACNGLVCDLSCFKEEVDVRVTHLPSLCDRPVLDFAHLPGFRVEGLHFFTSSCRIFLSPYTQLDRNSSVSYSNDLVIQLSLLRNYWVGGNRPDGKHRAEIRKLCNFRQYFGFLDHLSGQPSWLIRTDIK